MSQPFQPRLHYMGVSLVKAEVLVTAHVTSVLLNSHRPMFRVLYKRVVLVNPRIMGVVGIRRFEGVASTSVSRLTNIWQLMKLPRSCPSPGQTCFRHHVKLHGGQDQVYNVQDRY